MSDFRDFTGVRLSAPMGPPPNVTLPKDATRMREVLEESLSAELIQHLHLINLMLVAVPAPVPDTPRRQIGFFAADQGT